MPDKVTRITTIKKHGKNGALVLLIGAIPSSFAAWQSYEKGKREADVGYQTLVAGYQTLVTEAKQQRESNQALAKHLEEVEKNCIQKHDETQRTIIRALMDRPRSESLRGAVGSGFGTVGSGTSSGAASLHDPVKATNPFRPPEMPANLDVAQQPSNQMYRPKAK